MVRTAFITVVDYDFFPGALASVNSILTFHPNVRVHVVENMHRPLSEPQRDLLRSQSAIVLRSSDEFRRDDRFIGPWELKAYAACDIAESADYDVIVGLDADAVLCSSIEDVIEQARSGYFTAPNDGGGTYYDEAYSSYGINTPVHNPRYLSSALYACPCSGEFRDVLGRWDRAVSNAQFNGTGRLPGHGDQGVLNAVLFAAGESSRAIVLPNELWSQHWTFWESIIDFDGKSFINRSFGNSRQRCFHCGGAEKFWSTEYSQRIRSSHPLQSYVYGWYLAMLWFGPVRDWSLDPYLYLPPSSWHLFRDVVRYSKLVFPVFPPSRHNWSEISDVMIDRFLDGIPRAMSLGPGSLRELFAIVERHPHWTRFVEVGAYEGGSALALALRFLDRDLDFTTIESFMGNKNGTMDGWRLPSQDTCEANFASNAFLNARLVVAESRFAAQMFHKASIDCVFIDACHDTASVLQDIDHWLPRIKQGGVIAGDDYGWSSVREAVHTRFADVQVTPSGSVWWVPIAASQSVGTST